MNIFKGVSIKWPVNRLLRTLPGCKSWLLYDKVKVYTCFLKLYNQNNFWGHSGLKHFTVSYILLGQFVLRRQWFYMEGSERTEHQDKSFNVSFRCACEKWRKFWRWFVTGSWRYVSLEELCFHIVLKFRKRENWALSGLRSSELTLKVLKMAHTHFTGPFIC